MIQEKMIKHFKFFKDELTEEYNSEEVSFLKVYISYFYPPKLFTSLICYLLLNGLIFEKKRIKRLYFVTRNLNGYWNEWNLGTTHTKCLLKRFLKEGYFGKGATCIPGIFKGNLVVWSRTITDEELELMVFINGEFQPKVITYDCLSLDDVFFIMEFPYRIPPLDLVCKKALFFSQLWWEKYQCLCKNTFFNFCEDNVFLQTLRCIFFLSKNYKLKKVINEILIKGIISVDEVMFILKTLFSTISNEMEIRSAL